MIDQQQAKTIIAEGDVSVLVSSAEHIGSELSRQLTTSQIRNVFGEVRRIEMAWPPAGSISNTTEQRRAQDAFRQVILLRPKLAYLAGRERGRGVEILKETLDPCLRIIQETKSLEERRLYFDRFVDFFEAILAYHRSAGGK